MKLAMTSIAVTASICASASEAALLPASFMQFSLDLGTIHRGQAKASMTRFVFTRNTPRRVFAGLSPHSGEYRQSQGRTAMRRHFGSRAAGLCARDGILHANVW